MKFLKTPMLLMIAVLMCLAMIRLGVWQLDRAAQKQSILSEVEQRAAMPPILLTDLMESSTSLSSERFRSVVVSGRYLPKKSLYLDNQVFDSMVGYRIFTPFAIAESDKTVLVDRGWIPVGENRSEQPAFSTPTGTLTLTGRINTPPEKPPLWDNSFPVVTGDVWQYLPVNQIAETLQLDLLSMVVELPPVEGDTESVLFKRRWQKIDDQWVATHHGYAFQWFALAAAFFVACMVLFIRSQHAARKRQ